MWPILMLSLALNVVAPASRGVEAIVDETRIVILINNERLARGLPALHLDPSLTRRARRHAQEMAAEGRIWHTEDLHAAVPGWRLLGENVGHASAAVDVFAYFMESPRHRALVMDGSFTHIGKGVTIRDGSRFATIMFGAH